MNKNIEKKGKIGIITLNGYFNFGNRLQNYALTKILEQKGYLVYTLWKRNTADIIRNFIKHKLFFIKKYDRFRKFYLFSKNNMKELTRNSKNINSLDYYVIGSDQVWNYKLMDKDNTWFDAPENKITFSYAASLGTSSIPEEFAPKLKKQLLQYEYISVREEKGKELLKSIIPSKNIDVIIDPTLVLGVEEWNKLIDNTKLKLPEKYLIVYFLGDIKSTDYHEIEGYAKKENLKIINILDPKSEFYNVGPKEFVYLIKNANLICTDSFHACVFSFKFDKSFIIFRRSGEGISNDMYSRLENLLNLFKLQNREFNGIKITHENIIHDYTIGYEILKKEKLKSDEFLERIFNLN